MPAQPYVSRDRGVMGRHIDQAKARGHRRVGRLVVRPAGREQPDRDEPARDARRGGGPRLPAGGRRRGAPARSSAAPGDVQAALATLLATHAQHPAYLRSDGKPVIFFWRQQRFNTGTWAAIRDAVDPGHDSIWIEEGVDVSPLSVFDGHHLYSVTWNPPTDMAYTANKFANARVRGRREARRAEGLRGDGDARLRRPQDRPRQRLRGGPRGWRLLRPLVAGSHRQRARLDRHHQFQRVARGHLYRAEPGVRQRVSGPDGAVGGGLPGLGSTAAAAAGAQPKPAAAAPPRREACRLCRQPTPTAEAKPTPTPDARARLRPTPESVCPGVPDRY